MIRQSNAASASYNVIKFGAKPDGKTDSTQPFLKAWSAACSSASPSTIYVPKGRYLLRATVFRGPCKNKITVQIDGTLVAPADYRALGNSGYWILFIKVNRVSVFGGTLDAKGAGFWACRKSGQNCPVGARTKALTPTVFTCKHRPELQSRTGSTLQTGDDCISIGPSTRNLLMSSIKCGPGHGISIGSLGKEFNEDGVENITLTNSIFSGSDNGVRIKSWARPSNGFVRNVVFQNLIMKNVKNPIIIDQNYCPDNQGCPGQSSGVQISQVTYRNIQGTSATPEAVTFDCSTRNPCRGIELQDIKLTYTNTAATSSCKNIGGTISGVLMPESCI
ncbi:polygalacturonase-like [Populus alba x Populus x berolinensis]|uniref:Polygalacturonase-like n=1 Tax=Populus alba x Populus x berolinensis TaxID=444605 RepID=A0AAD6LDX8_9ROSI|nr:polygalacturonase-like [Populus alba x Populus x berolinensis]